MAQWSLTRNAPLPYDDTLYEQYIQVDKYGTFVGPESIGNASGYSAFGEQISIPVTPVVQADAVYGLSDDQLETFSASGGSVTNSSSLFTLSSGTSLGGYGTLQSRRAIRYRPGQGAMARFTAGFVNPASGYTLRAGFGTLEDAIQIGYNGDQFGILRQTGGKAAIYRFTISAAASGAETVTFTLNGTAFNVTLASGTAAQNAATIAAATFTGWRVENHADNVVFMRQSVGPTAGAFTVSSTGTFNGTYASLQTGVAHTENWTYQNDFSDDKLNGRGPSKMNIDPSKLNVFQISFRWLGAGEIKFAIENQENGEMITFHHIHYVNQNTTPHLDNPSLKLQYVAASIGGTGTNAQVYGSSMMGAIEGLIRPSDRPRGVGNSRSSLNSGGTYYHMLTIRNNQVFNNKVNQREVILESLTAGAVSAASTPIRVIIYNNDVVPAVNLQFSQVSLANSFVDYSTQATTLTHDTGNVIHSFTIMPGAAAYIDLRPLRLVVPPFRKLSVGLVAQGVVSNADVTLNWTED